MVKLKKIVVYNPAAAESGALSILKDFYNYVYNNNFDIEWIFIVSTDQLVSERPNIHIHKVQKGNWNTRIKFELFEIRKIINYYNPDIVFSLQNLAIMFIKQPQVVYLHQSLPFSKDNFFSILKKDERIYFFYKYIYKLLIHISLKKSKKTIVQTKWMKEAVYLDFKFEKDKIEVIPPCVQIPEINKIVSRTDCFFYPTGPFKYKNILMLIQAIKLVVNHGYHPVLSITITGDENDYAKCAKKEAAGYEKNVKFIGRVSRDSIFNFYTSSTLIFPSFLESFGLPLLEARMSGSFIIASNTPFAKEILNGYENILFFEKDSVLELAERIEQYLNIKEQSGNKVGERLSVDALDQYAPVNTWGQIIEILKRL